MSTETSSAGQAPVGNMEQAEEALNQLRAASMAGDTVAKRKLGTVLLTVPRGPNDFLEGAAVTVSAANDGDGKSAYRTAILCAGAVAMPQNWSVALVYLQRAAELGYRLAQEELAALSGDKDLAARALNGEEAAADVWSRLRHSVNLKSLLKIPGAKTLSVSPRMAAVENLVSPELCDRIIAQTRAKLQPVDGPDGNPLALEVAGCYRLSIPEFTLQTILMLERIGEAVGLKHRGVEPPMVVRYSGGQEFPAHSDVLDTKNPANAENVRLEGQRIITFVLFLNDDYEGGETDFPVAEKQFKGKKGDALFWWNIDQDGSFNRASVNGNRAVTSGEKWVLCQWIRSFVPG